MNYTPGTVLAVDFGPFKHVGLWTEIGTVISNSKKSGCVQEEDIHAFSGGRPIEVIGYIGNLAPADVIRRARSKIGTKWNLLKNNCEHFVHEIHGQSKKSPQLMKWGIAFTLIIGVVLLMWRK